MPQLNQNNTLSFIMLLVVIVAGQIAILFQINQNYKKLTIDHKNTYLSSDWIIEGAGLKNPND